MKKAILLSLSAIVVVGVVGFGLSKSIGTKDIIGIDEARAKTEKFINENLLSNGMTVEIKEVKDEGDLYSIALVVSGQEYTSYITKDGKKFFQSAIDIEEIEKAKQAETGSQSQNTPTVASKSDKPTVELFVMSHCPYGTQIEKGILPVVELLQDKINFELKFCDYAMHGQTELNEQLNQYCIQKQSSDKLLAYLNCFLADSDGQDCLVKAGIDQSVLNSCVSQTDSQYKVTESFKDKDTWRKKKNEKGEWEPAYPVFNVYQADNEKYGIQGSPGLVINGVSVSANRDSASLLSVICSAFNEVPEVCGAQLSTTSPSPGFGFEGSGSDTAATCN